LLLRFFLGDSIGFLDPARKLITAAGDYVKMVIGKLAPLFFDLTFELLPISLNLVPVHINAPYVPTLIKNTGTCFIS
jgi:hypothetical protein